MSNYSVWGGWLGPGVLQNFAAGDRAWPFPCSTLTGQCSGALSEVFLDCPIRPLMNG